MIFLLEVLAVACLFFSVLENLSCDFFVGGSGGRMFVFKCFRKFAVNFILWYDFFVGRSGGRALLV